MKILNNFQDREVTKSSLTCLLEKRGDNVKIKFTDVINKLHENYRDK